MEAEGLCITPREMRTPAGDFPLADITALRRRVRTPLLGPVVLAILGTVNLVAALRTGWWLDVIATAVMFGGGLLWWLLGTRYVLVVGTGGGDVEAWLTRHKRVFDQAMEVGQAQIDRRRA